MSEAVVVGRLRIRSGRGIDPLLLRLRAAHLLETADLTPSGLPPGAILYIRRLADPLPGRLSLAAPQLTPDRAWQAALTARLDALAAHAERPLGQAVSAGAQAVLFVDQGEMLACLALDWLAEQLLNRWWWREVVRNRQLGSAVVDAWLSALDAAPAALAHLNRRGEAVAFLRRLDDEDVARLLTGLVERHRLAALGEVAQATLRTASMRSSGLRDAGSTAAFAGSPERPEAGPLERSAGSGREDETFREAGAAGEGASRTREGGAAVAPWQGLVPADSAGLSMPRQLLLGVGLALVHAPSAVRGEAYARQVELWYAGRPAEPVERTATPPAPPEVPSTREDAAGRESLTAERRPDGQAGGADRDGIPPDAPYPEGVHRRDEAQMTGPGETAATAERTGAERAEATGSDRPLPNEEAGLAVGTDGAEAAGASAAAGVAAGAAPAGPAAREDAALEVVEVRTGYAGLFYLVNAALGMGFYADFTQPDAEGELALSPWAFLALIGRALIGDALQADPVWPLLARLAGAEGADAGWTDPLAAGFALPDSLGVAEWIETTAGQVFEWIAARFPKPLAGCAELAGIAFARSGQIRVSAGRLDVVLRLDDLDIAVRMAGLDRNPGWVPAAGRTISFHYE